MRFLFYVLLLLACSLGSRSFAQNYALYNSYYINPYLYNPAEVATEFTYVFVNHRQQWMGIEGAPTIANFTLQAPASARVGFGLSVTNDVKGLLNNSSVLLTFGYNVPLADQVFVRFGISGGGAWNMVDLEKIGSLDNDNALANLLENNASLTGNAGISFHSNHCFAGCMRRQ